MNALWLIDLTESKTVVKTFFDSYWAAFLNNQKDPDYSDGKREPWFCISTPDDLGLTVDDDTTAQEIGNRVYAAVRKADNLINPDNGMIRYDFKDQNEFNRIIVIFLGDTEALSTHRFFLPLSTSLKVDTQQATHWNTTTNVYFYGMLYRREEVSNGAHLNANEKAFLNQLHNMQNAWKTFDNVLFFEKPATQKDDAIKDMALASLHLAFEDSHSSTVLKKYSDRDPKPIYLNAGVSGIYYERNVQNDREAFLTGHTLLDAFANSTEKEFYDLDSAKERAQNISVFRNKELDENNLYKKLSAGMPNLDTAGFDIKMPIRPGSLKIAEVWRRYFDNENGYVANLKAKLVNTVRLELATFEHEYLERLANNQLEWIKKQSREVEDGIFGVFDDEHPDPHCSMKQAIEVAKQAEILASKQTQAVDVISLADSDGLTIEPVPIPERYEKAYKTALLEKEKTEKRILDELDTRLRRHPVFMLSMFSRALLLSILSSALFLFINPIASIVLFIIPIAVYFLAYRRYMNILKSLQERYIAMSLVKLNNKIRQEYRKAIHKSQSDIADYCKWNWENRLTKIRNGLGVLVPKKFNFSPFSDFQPLFTDTLKIEANSTFKRVALNDETAEETPAIESGKFDDIPVLATVPNFEVKLDSITNCKSVTALNNGEKMKLIHQLMKQTATVPQRMVENLDPTKMVMKTSCEAITLMLDVSGSMSGEPLKQLKEALEELKKKFGDQLRWVAFGSYAKWDKDVDYDIDKADSECGSGTSYGPALDLMLEASQRGNIDLGKVVIISDGEPSDVREAQQKVLELGCVVDVIYIGHGNQQFLTDLAESTGGALQQVDKVEEAQIETIVEDGIATAFKLSQAGDFPFGDLLRKSALKECMKALLIFSKDILVSNDESLEQMIAERGNDAGLRNWIEKRAKLCTTNPGFVQKQADILIKSSGIEQHKMMQKITGVSAKVNAGDTTKYKLVTPKAKIGDSTYKPDSPDILLTQLHIQPLGAICDLGWAFDPDQDRQLNSEERFDMLFRSYFGQNVYPFVNIYNRPIA